MTVRDFLITGIALTGAAPAWGAEADKLVTHEVPAGALYTHHNDDFTVRVRLPGGAWRDIYEYEVKVDLDDPQSASMASFDLGGPVEVAVKKNNGDVRRVEVRPESASVRARLVGNTAYFTLKRPANISVEFDGDRLHNLHLFANPPETERPGPKGAGVIYFGPGIHKPPEGKDHFPIPSNSTVYIDGGALLQGGVEIRGAENVRVIGRGIIDRPQTGFTIAKSRNVTIDGPIVRNPGHYTVSCGQSSGLTIVNLKAISAAKWSDGIDHMSCSDVRIDGVFLRTSDDSVAIYGSRWDYKGDARNYLVTNSVLWADVAHPINIGLHGSRDEPEVIENIVFRNIDVLGHDEDDRNYQGVMAISDGDNNLVRKVVFEDFRIDNIEEGMLFNIRAVFNEKYGLAPGRGVEDIVIRNVRFRGGDINRPVIAGHSADRMVRGVTIENVVVAGKPLKGGDIDVGPFVANVVVKP